VGQQLCWQCERLETLENSCTGSGGDRGTRSKERAVAAGPRIGSVASFNLARRHAVVLLRAKREDTRREAMNQWSSAVAWTSLRHSAGRDGDTGNAGICLLEARTAPLLTVGTAAAHSVCAAAAGAEMVRFWMSLKIMTLLPSRLSRAL
jgi:hypothetical protein